MAFNFFFANQVPSFFIEMEIMILLNFFLFSMNWYNHSLAQASELLLRWAIWPKGLVLGFYKQHQVSKCPRNSQWRTPLRVTPGRIENDQTPYSQSEAKTRHWHSFLFAVLHICVFTELQNDQTPYSQNETKFHHWHLFLLAVLNICVFTLRLVLKQLNSVWEALENLE